MTRIEFMQGWALLTAQPWGWSYRTQKAVSTTEPGPSEIQSELYYQAFRHLDGKPWFSVCLAQSHGDKWPSIDTLKQSLQVIPRPAGPVVRQIESVTSMEEALKERPDLQATLKRVLKTNGVDL